MKRATFIDLLMTVEELNEKLKQLETFVGGPVDCLNHTMCSILDAISEDMGLNKFDDDIACIIFDYCFNHDFGDKYDETPLVTIDDKKYFPKRFTELYNVIIEMVGDANQ